MINWTNGFRKIERERRTLQTRQGDLIAQMMQTLASTAVWLHLQNTPLTAPYGRCVACLAPLDCDGDCLECAARELELLGKEN